MKYETATGYELTVINGDNQSNCYAPPVLHLIEITPEILNQIREERNREWNSKKPMLDGLVEEMTIKSKELEKRSRHLARTAIQ